MPVKDTSSGGDNDYWLVKVPDPKRLDPYEAECEDIIEALDMTFAEGNAFKAIWRKCADRQGNGKPGDNPLRNAQKVRYYGSRMEVQEERLITNATPILAGGESWVNNIDGGRSITKSRDCE